MNIKTESLNHYLTRPISDNLVDLLKADIEQNGYYGLSPLVVGQKDDECFVLCGNHRLTAARELDIKELPCTVIEADEDEWLRLAIRDNEVNKTLKQDDLFDWLFRIGKEKEKGLTQVQIGERVGWSRKRVSDHVAIIDGIAPKVLKMTQKSQVGRGAENEPNGAFNFTEGWFRNSGLYGLNPENQMALMEWFIENKFPTSKKVTERAGWLKLKQDAAVYVEKHLMDGSDEAGQILNNVQKGLYKDMVQVERAVKQSNDQFLDRQRIQIVHQDGLDMLKGLPDGSVDCIITDPPYNVTENDWDKFESDQDYLDFLRSYLQEFKRVLKSEYHLFMFVDPEYMARAELLMIDVGFKINSRIVWVRKNISMGRVVHDRFISQWEPAFHSGTKPLAFPKEWGDERGDVQTYAVPQSNFNDKKEHPTQKPLGLISRMVELATDIGDMVVDPFCGAGTTAKACEDLNRKCITSDTSDQYVKIATERVFGGKK